MDTVLRNETAYERLRAWAIEYAAFRDCSFFHISPFTFGLRGPNGVINVALSSVPNQVHLFNEVHRSFDLYVPFDEAAAHLRFIVNATT